MIFLQFHWIFVFQLSYKINISISCESIMLREPNRRVSWDQHVKMSCTCLKQKIHYPFKWIQLIEWSHYLNMNNWLHLQISDTPWKGFELAQNLKLGLVEWSCAVLITAAPRHQFCSSDNHARMRQLSERMRQFFLSFYHGLWWQMWCSNIQKQLLQVFWKQRCS